MTQPTLSQEQGEFAFDFDSFSARMQALSTTPFEPVSANIPEPLHDLGYDGYRRIQYQGDGKWAADNLGYRLQAFHLGWLYTEPVKVFEIEAGTARFPGRPACASTTRSIAPTPMTN